MTESANEAIIRSAYQAYAEDDLARMLQFVDPTWSGPTSTPPKRIRNPRSVMDGMNWRPH
jgi:hypothetical protein